MDSEKLKTILMNYTKNIWINIDKILETTLALNQFKIMSTRKINGFNKKYL